MLALIAEITDLLGQLISQDFGSRTIANATAQLRHTIGDPTMPTAPVAICQPQHPRYTVQQDHPSIFWRIYENGIPTSITGGRVDIATVAQALNEQRARLSSLPALITEPTSQNAQLN